MNTKTNKKLLVVTPYFPPYGGGLERYAYEISTRLKLDYGWNIVFVSAGEFKGKDTKTTQNGITIYRLGYNFKFSNTPFSFSWFKKAKKILKDEKPDIMNVQTPVPGIGNIFAYLANKTPLVVTYHAGSMKKGKMVTDIPVGIYEMTLLPLLLRSAKKIVTASSFVRDVFLKNYKEKSVTVTPGTNTHVFVPNNKFKNKRPTILFVAGLGHAEQYKGLQTLIDTVGQLKKNIPNILVNVTGDGDMRSEYEVRVEKLGLKENFIFYGRLKGEELANRYKAAWVFVLPTENDNIPTVIIEAMASSLPVVAYSIGSIPDLISDGKTGYLVKVGDKKDLNEKVYKLLTNNKLAAEFGKAGRVKAVSDFDWDTKAYETNIVLSEEIKKMSALDIVNIAAYYPPHMGGMEVVVQEVSRVLANNHNVRVVTSNIGDDSFLRKDSATFCVSRLKSVEIAHTPIMWLLPIKLLLMRRKSIFHIHIAQAGMPEIALIIAKIRGFKVISHFHLDVEPSGKFGFVFVLYKKYVLGMTLRNSDRVIVFSEAQKQIVHEKYQVKKEKIVIIPNGVADEFFYKRGTKVTSGTLKILFVGRLAIQKRVDRLIEAVALVKSKVEVTIVGDGEDREKLKNQVKSLNLKNVTFVGRKSGKELLDYYFNSDLFLITSDKEGMPLVVLEAMAAGLPIIASDVTGLRELVSGTGILVKPVAETFAHAIDKLSANKQELLKLSQKSSKKAHEYSWSKVSERIVKIYEEVQK